MLISERADRVARKKGPREMVCLLKQVVKQDKDKPITVNRDIYGHEIYDPSKKEKRAHSTILKSAKFTYRKMETFKEEQNQI